MVADASSEDVVALDNNSLTDRLLGTDDVSEQAQHGDCATQDQQDGEEGEHQVHKNHHTVYPKGALGFRSNVWDEFFEICNLSWPVALSTLSRLAIMSTDTSFIGHLGTRELTSVSLAGAWADFCSVVVWSPAYCLNSLCSQAIGAGNKKLAGVWLQLAFFFCTVICLIVIGFYFLTETVVGMISEQPGIPHMSQQYNAFAALSLWPMVMYMALRQYFQALQIVRPAFVVSTITVFFNFAMNELLVFGIDGYGGLGLIGSPLATFCSMIFQIVSFCTYVIFIKKYHADYWDGFSLECFRADRMRRYIKVALPMTIGSAVENWSFQIIAFASGKLEPSDTAAMFVMYSVWGLLWSFYWGWGLALQVRLGKHLGEGDIRSAKLVVKLSIFIVAIVVIIVDIACMALSHDLPLIFTKDPEVVRKAGDAMHILCLDYLMGCSTLCATSILEGMARNTIMSVVLSAVSWGVSMPAAIYFAFYCPWFAEDQIHGFWWGSVLGETVKSIVLWTIVYKTNWKQMAIDARERSERDTDVIVDDDAEAGDEEEGRASSSAAAVSPGGVSAIEEQLLVSASPRMSASPAVRRSPRVG